MKILFAFPSRSRPEKFRITFKKLLASLIRPELCAINVVVDDNDQRKPEYMQIIGNLSYVKIFTPYGNAANKIDAVNKACICPEFDWDIVVVMSDDMHVVLNGIDERIRNDMSRHYPNKDGLLHYNDGSANQKLITFAVMGRMLYDMFGFLYNPEYKSLYCDNEQMEVADMLGRRAYIPIQVVEHRHPSHGAKFKRENDEQYKHTESFDKVDKATYKKRKAMNYDLPLLTICIPTVVGREDKFARLMSEIERQRMALPDPKMVQVISECDNKEISIGAKRDKMLRKSKGLFTQQTDDDDNLHPLALYYWTWTIQNHPECTHIGFIEHCTFDGKNPTPVDRSSRYPDWGDNINGFKHVRTPDNKNPIRTALCIAAGGYADMRYGEDHDFSRRALPFLKSEAYIKKELYLYRYESEEHSKKYGIAK